MRMWTAGFVLLAIALPSHAQNHPFGSHPMPYAAGAITPSHVSQASQDQIVRNFYDAWKARYLVPACGPGRYVVKANVINSSNLTVSEAHGYGMLLAALMAGHDPEARTIFDGMFTYFREHPSVYSNYLMAWFQRSTCASAQGSDSASDGDLDIAYALLLADKQWGSCGAIDYAAEAGNVLTAIEAGELDSSGSYLRLGDWTAPSEPQFYESTRSSDFMPGHLRAYATISGNSVWSDVLDHTYSLFDALQTTHSPVAGLIPDFIADPLGAGAPVAPFFLEGPNDGDYDYNACRVPWRVGTDFVASGDARAKTIAQRMTTWFRSTTGNDPENIQAGYQLDGTSSPDANFRSMAFVAPLGVGAMTDSANQAWLNDIWDLVVATPLDAEAYYENSLKLLSMIVMSGNWWSPQAVSGGCIPPASTPICTGGGLLTNLKLTLGSLASGVGRQRLTLKGTLFFPQGIPVAAPFTDGAQMLIEDRGNGDASIFELSRFTNPIPPLSAGTCSPADGWSSQRNSYRNRSGSIDPPTCVAGSANGLAEIRYKVKNAYDIEIRATARRSTVTAPIGPLRLSWALGSSQTASDNGYCAFSMDLPCTSNGSGSTQRCK